MMIKLNDVRVLRNILGDKYEDDKDVTLPKYEPKKLGWGGWTMPKLSSKFLSKDKWSWNEKLGKLDIYDTPTVPGWNEKLGKLEAYDTPASGWNEKLGELKVYDTSTPAEPQGESADRESAIAQDAKIQSALDTSQAKLDKQITYLETQKKLAEREKELEWASSPERLQIEAATRLEHAQKLREAAEIGRIGKSAWEAKQKALWLRESMAYRQQEQAAEAQARELEGQRGLAKFEQSVFGQFLKGPLTKTAGRAVENIGQNLGGSIVGPFTQPGASKHLSDTVRNRNAYIELVKTRYRSKKPPQVLHGASDIAAYGTAGERKRLAELDRAVERAQSVLSSSGFMGGTSGQFILKRARQAPQLQPFTQVGYGGGSLGEYPMEAFGKLGVRQSLTAVSPGAKWDALLGRGSAAGESSDRITRILGRKPDPEGAMAKLKRFL